MARLDDRDRGMGVDQLDERARDLEREVLLKDQPMRERVDQPRDPREPRHAVVRQERDVDGALRGQEVMRADEHHRNAERDDGTPRLHRETRAERLLRRGPIAGEQPVAEGARNGARCRGERVRAGVETERVEEQTDRLLGSREVRRFAAAFLRSR